VSPYLERKRSEGLLFLSGCVMRLQLVRSPREGLHRISRRETASRERLRRWDAKASALHLSSCAFGAREIRWQERFGARLSRRRRASACHRISRDKRCVSEVKVAVGNLTLSACSPSAREIRCKPSRCLWHF